MNEDEKRASLSAAQRLFLAEIELQLERFSSMRWLRTRPTTAPVDDAVIWAREIETPDMTLALVATREALDAATIMIRAVGKPGRKAFMKDVTTGSPALEATLRDLVGFPPMTPSSRRPNQPLRRSRPRRRS